LESTIAAEEIRSSIAVRMKMQNSIEEEWNTDAKPKK
jgi:hypothetical protein